MLYDIPLNSKPTVVWPIASCLFTCRFPVSSHDAILSYGNGMFQSISRKLNQARPLVRRDRICNTVKVLLVRTSIDFKKESMLRGIPHHLNGI
ncbi:hypothetical protein HZ326_27012 [Fusarium oxysporum f. sp. albedinis]|nr:hypothetical protein HZ326_27012 [Fusarium oxysporum f. sp. albedinis]